MRILFVVMLSLFVCELSLHAMPTKTRLRKRSNASWDTEAQAELTDADDSNQSIMATLSEWGLSQVCPIPHVSCFISYVSNKKLCASCEQRLDMNLLKQATHKAGTFLQKNKQEVLEWTRHFVCTGIGSYFGLTVLSNIYCFSPPGLAMLSGALIFSGVATLIIDHQDVYENSKAKATYLFAFLVSFYLQHLRLLESYECDAI